MTEFVNIRIQNEKALVDPDLKELVNKLEIPFPIFLDLEDARCGR